MSNKFLSSLLLLIVFLIETAKFQRSSSSSSENFESILTITTKINPVKTGDIVQCEIVGLGKTLKLEQSNEIYNKDITTDKLISFPYSENCLTFQLQAKDSLSIGLVEVSKDGNRNEENGFVITIGNDVSQIRRNCSYLIMFALSCDNIVKQLETTDIISETQMRGFWISWSENTIKIGRDGEKYPFLEYEERNEIVINKVVINPVQSYRAKLRVDEPKCPGYKSGFNADVQNAETKCWFQLRTLDMIKYHKLAEGHLKQIKTDYGNFNRTSHRAKGYLDRALSDLEATFDRAMKLNAEILETSSSGYQDELTTQIFAEIKDVFFNYYASLQQEMDRPRNATNLKLIPPNKFSNLNTLDSITYSYFKTKVECFTFKVLSSHDINIALTPDLETVPHPIQIILGGWFNTKSALLKDAILLTEMDTTGILSKTEYRGFWIQWADRTIKIGREGETAPFLMQENREFYNYNFVGLRTTNGATGTWVIEDPNCPPTHDQLRQSENIKLNFNVAG